MPNESELHAGQPAEAAFAGHGPGYEVRDTNVRSIITFLVGLTLFIIVSQVALWGLFRGISGGEPEPPSPLSTPAMLTEQLRALHAREDAALGLGKEAKPGPGRISIDDAIDRLIEQGIPPIEPSHTEADVNSHSGTPAREIKTKDAAGKDKDQSTPRDQDQGQEAPQDKAHEQSGQGDDR